MNDYMAAFRTVYDNICIGLVIRCIIEAATCHGKYMQTDLAIYSKETSLWIATAWLVVLSLHI